MRLSTSLLPRAEGHPRRVAAAIALAVGGLAWPQLAAAATPLAVWHLDELPDATATVDSSGNGNHGVPTGIALGQPGVAGTSYGFTGAPSYVTVPDSASLNPGVADFSFTVVVQFTAVPDTDYDLLRKGLSSTDGGSYKVEILKKQHGTIAVATCHYIGSSDRAGVGIKQLNLADGLWHSITCTKTGDAISITVDGTTNSKSVRIGSIANAMPVWLGAKFRRSSPLDLYQGLMDEVSIQLL